MIKMNRIKPPVHVSTSPPRGIAQGIVIAAVLVLGIGASLTYWLTTRDASESVDDEASPSWGEVRLEKIPVTVVAEGDLVAKDDVDIYNVIEHPDDERIKDIIEEGTWVVEGDWLYTLSSPGLVADRDEWISRVREAKAELEEAKRNMEIEVDTAASAEAKAKLTLEIAELAYQQWKLGTHPQRERDLELAQEKADRELDLATREVVLSKELFAKDYISQTELEQDEIRLIEAKNAIKTAKLDMEVYHKYEKVKAEKEVKSDISQAKEELGRTKRKNQNKIELMQAQITSEVNELEQRELRLKDLERMVDAMEVKAPSSGVVIYSSTIGNRRERWYTIRKGVEVRGGWRVMVLSDTTQMVANLYVHESRINDIEPGQKVNVKVNAQADEVYTATIVEKKNSAIQDGSSSNPHLRQYLVIANMPKNLGEDIRPGMNCSAEIFIREIPETLAIPIQAVHTEGEDHFVYVKAEGGKVRRNAVKLGGASDTLVQVSKGLEEGTQVLLRNPQPGELLPDDASARFDSEEVATQDDRFRVDQGEQPTSGPKSKPTSNNPDGKADRPKRLDRKAPAGGGTGEKRPKNKA